MTLTVEAVYQGGVFKPVRPVDLPENQRVTVLVAAPASANGRGVPVDEVLGLAAGNSPPPDDETVRRWVGEYRMKKAGF
jgi:predicted DNA-binding antitoxin AbrB/MazE fold protein